MSIRVGTNRNDCRTDTRHGREYVPFLGVSRLDPTTGGGKGEGRRGAFIFSHAL